MWLGFSFAAAAAVAVLYVPGFIMLRGLGFSRLLALACAPVCAFAMLGVLPIAFGLLSIPCGAPGMAGAILLVAVVVYALFRVPALSRRIPRTALPPSRGFSVGGRTVPFDPAIAALYVAVGAAACAGVFLCSLSAPDAVMWRWDNMFHVNLVRRFVDSGNWSSLSSTIYPLDAGDADPFLDKDGGFYPAAWHALVAFACGLAGCGVPVAVNAVDAVLVSLCLPLGVFALNKVLLEGDDVAVFLGAPLALSFPALPWGFFVKGPLYPNLAGLAIVAPVAAVAMLYARDAFRRLRAPGAPDGPSACETSIEQGDRAVGVSRPRGDARPDGAAISQSVLLPASAFAVLAFCGLALSHPNSLFALYVLLVPFGAHCISDAADARARAAGGPAAGKRKKAAVLALYLACCIGFWLACCCLPFLRSTVDFNTEVSTGWAASAIDLVTGAMPTFKPQPVLALACIAGIVATAKGKNRWLLATIAFFSVGYVLARSTLGWPRHVVAGFWYTDCYRMAAYLALFSVPVAASGCSAAVRVFCGIFGRRDAADAKAPVAVPAFGAPDAPDSSAPGPAALPDAADTGGRAASGRRVWVAAVFAAALLAGFDFSPNIVAPDGAAPVRTGMGYAVDEMKNLYASDRTQVYSREEREFVERCMDVLPEGALVLNFAHDGSAFAYGVDGMNVYFRNGHTTNQAEWAQAIRLSLCDYATDATVQEAVGKTGARYVLLLDVGSSPSSGTWMPQYKKHPERWAGISSIDDRTPGFTAVLSDGDMRLYRIDDLPEAASPQGR